MTTWEGEAIIADWFRRVGEGGLPTLDAGLIREIDYEAYASVMLRRGVEMSARNAGVLEEHLQHVRRTTEDRFDWAEGSPPKPSRSIDEKDRVFVLAMFDVAQRIEHRLTRALHLLRATPDVRIRRKRLDVGIEREARAAANGAIRLAGVLGSLAEIDAESFSTACFTSSAALAMSEAGEMAQARLDDYYIARGVKRERDDQKGKQAQAEQSAAKMYAQHATVVMAMTNALEANRRRRKPLTLHRVAQLTAPSILHLKGKRKGKPLYDVRQIEAICKSHGLA